MELNGKDNDTFEGFDLGPIFPIQFQNATDVEDDEDNVMPMLVQIGWTTIFSIMIFISFGGNCIVIWIVIAHRRMRTVTNYFLVNLSLADLLLTTLNCFFNSIYMIQRDWPFGRFYCTISNFIANATVAASVFTLTGISCDRFLAIVHPLQPRMSRTSSLITIAFIWGASMLFALPCLLYSTTITDRYNDGRERTACVLIWPDGKLIGSKFDFGYQLMFLIITYVIPVTLMILSYSIMGKELWGSKYIGEMTQRQLDSVRSKRKIVKMFILIVFIFAICWLPYHGYFLYVYFDTSIIFRKYTQHIYLGFYWFAMSNAMVNPIIYYWMNARFRQYFKRAICGWRNCRSYSRNRTKRTTFMYQPSNSFSKSGMNESMRRKRPADEIKENLHLHQQTTLTKIQADNERNEDGVNKDCERWMRLMNRNHLGNHQQTSVQL